MSDDIPAAPQIPPLFLGRFVVDEATPFQRCLNRLEVEVAKEDYRQLLAVERLGRPLAESTYAGMDDLTPRILATTQNDYNRRLLQERGVRIYLDPANYNVYYRQEQGGIRFVSVWRQGVLRRVFGAVPTQPVAWQPCPRLLPGFSAAFVPDEAGGSLLFRRDGASLAGAPLLTAAHGPYDPHTFDVLLYFLRSGKAGHALVNLGYSGREPLTDDNLARLVQWGLPLNPSNIDVIYPYTDRRGLPYAYKTERGLRRFVTALGAGVPGLIIDIHGCVGTSSDDQRLLIGLGGLQPFPVVATLGRLEQRDSVAHLFPHEPLRQGLELVRNLSEALYVQLCDSAESGYHFFVMGKLQMVGRAVDLKVDVASLLADEHRSYLPAEGVRWLPGAGANALQRLEASLLDPAILCLHVEIPTAVRRAIHHHLWELAIGESLDSSSL